jgi:ribonuclease J
MPNMQVRIHRGAREIGGSCVEVRQDDATILLDLGRPLWAAPGEHVPLPAAVGLGETGPLPLALFISHGHQDHWGLVPQLPDGVPIWIGKGAADVLRAAVFWGTGTDLHEHGHLHDRQAVTVGPFTVTPYLADHSGFDAYSLLVQAAGRRLFYSGDLRGHGRKASAFERLLTEPPDGVDALLLEGTNLRGADGPAEAQMNESTVETDLAATMRATAGMVVVLGSAQNIDRLVTVYRAALRSQRCLAVDLYGAEVAAATERASVPRPAADWPRVRAYLPQRQRVRVKQAKEFHRTAGVRPYRVFDEDLRAAPHQWVLFGAFQSHVSHLARAGLLDGAAVVWSMWDGYLAQPSGQRFTTLLAERGIPLVHHHTSGHASPTDLRRLVSAIGADVLVPIHTEAPHRYTELLGRTATAHADGVWWNV